MEELLNTISFQLYSPQGGGDGWVAAHPLGKRAAEKAGGICAVAGGQLLGGFCLEPEHLVRVWPLTANYSSSSNP